MAVEMKLTIKSSKPGALAYKVRYLTAVRLRCVGTEQCQHHAS